MHPGARLLVVGVVVLVCQACGKRGDPLPPLRSFPAAAEDLRIWQRGPFIHLEWRAPSRNTDGTTEVDLKEAVVLRRVEEIPEAVAPTQAPDTVAAADTVSDEEPPQPPPEAGGTGAPAERASGEGEKPENVPAETRTEVEQPRPAVPPPFPQGAEEIAALDAEESGGLLEFRDPWDPSWEGKRVEYAVRHLNRKGRPGRLSLVVSIDPIPPPPAPEDLSVDVGDGWARLDWKAPSATERMVDVGARGTFGYNVYRRSPPGGFPSRPLNQEPLAESTYEDRTVLFGQPWCYVVRLVFVAEPSSSPAAGGSSSALIESLDSGESCLTPVDTFPPPTPEDVVAIPSAEGVLVSWTTVLAPDLRGYLVYRATGTEENFELLTAEPLSRASFTDRNVEPGTTYIYTVTAVDEAEPWNESPRSRLVSAQVPAHP